MRRLAAAVLVLTAACGSPTSPSPLIPSGQSSTLLEGVWEIDYRVDQCVGYWYCGVVIQTAHTLTLRTTRSGSAVHGVVTIRGDSIDVAGTASSAGVLELHGVRKAAIATHAEIEVTKLEFGRDRTRYLGSLEYTVTGGSNDVSIFGQMRAAGRVTGARKLASSVRAGFGGVWRGWIAVRECSTIGWTQCSPVPSNIVHPLELTLTQQGSTVSGTLRVSGGVLAQVEGTIDGQSVSLQGETSNPSAAMTEVRVLRPTTLARDALGRLNGTLSFHIEWRPTPGSSWTYRATDFAKVELIGVILEPS
jgi:hypothetical protein